MKQFITDKFNNKLGHAVTMYQVLAKYGDVEVVAHSVDEQGTFFQLLPLYERFFDMDIKIISKEEYEKRGLKNESFAIYGREHEFRFIRPDFPRKRLIKEPYITTQFISDAPERSLHGYQVRDDIRVVSLDDRKWDMVELHQIIEGAEYHLSIDSGTAWVACSVHTPLHLLSFENNIPEIYLEWLSGRKAQWVDTPT